MKVGELNIGDEVTIQIGKKQPFRARVESQHPRHCQLHGELIGQVFRFRKMKTKNKPGYLFDLDFEYEPPLLEKGNG